MIHIVIEEKSFFDEVSFLNTDGSEKETVRAYGEKMATIVKILNIIGWIFTFFTCCKAKLIKIPGTRNNYLYDTTLRRHLTVNDLNNLANAISIVKKTSSFIDQSTKNLVKSLDVEDIKRAHQEVQKIKAADAAGKFTIEMGSPSKGELMCAYVQRRVKPDAQYPWVGKVILTATQEERFIGYFKNQQSAENAASFVLSIEDSSNHNQYKDECQASSTTAVTYPLIDDPLKDF